MRIGSIVMLLAAVVMAVTAGLLAQNWLEQQSRMARGQPVAIKSAEVAMTKIVVATMPLRYGAELTDTNVTEIDWPSRALPAGAFRSRAELFKSNERRAVLFAIEANEPILARKITGPGERPTVATLLDVGMTAVTIRVNDVNGVAGFVLPGHRVEILHTMVQNVQGEGRKSYTDVLLQNVRVIGIDQLADDRAEKAVVVKTVTVEVDIRSAQKLALAQTVGTLSLALRNAGSLMTERSERITVDDLGRPTMVAGPVPLASLPESRAPVEPPRVGVVNVTRGTKKSDYSVSLEKD